MRKPEQVSASYHLPFYIPATIPGLKLLRFFKLLSTRVTEIEIIYTFALPFWGF
jgi:hypothetical protein